MSLAAAGELRRIDEPPVAPERALGAGHLLEHPVIQPARLLAIDLTAMDMDAERIGLRVAIMGVTVWPLDRVIFADGPPLHGEDVCEALDAVGLRRLRLSVGLAGLRDRFRAHHVLGAGERQQIAQLGRVQHVAEPEVAQAPVIEIDCANARHAIALNLRPARLGAEEDAEPPRLDLRCQQAFQDHEADAWFEGQCGPPSTSPD